MTRLYERPLATREPPGIAVFPNGALACSDSGYLLPANETSFYRDLAEHYGEVEIVADVWQTEDEAGTVPAAQVGKLRIVQLASHRARLRRARSSFGALMAALKASARRSDLYVFFPGRVGILVSLLLALLRRRYALYVRNDIQAIPPFVRNVCLGRASFCIVTGAGIESSVRRYNPRTELVVPMMNVRPADLEIPRRPLAGRKRILFIGQVNERKGVETVMEVARLLAARGVEARTNIAGGGSADYLARLRAAAPRGEDGSALVRFLGPVDPERVRQELLEADVFLFPTQYNEGFPRVLYEAMTLGTPIVTTRLRIFSWLLEDRRNALLCEPVAEAFAAATAELFTRRGLTAAIGRNARETMARFFADLPDHSHALQVIRRYAGQGSSESPVERGQAPGRQTVYNGRSGE